MDRQLAKLANNIENSLLSTPGERNDNVVDSMSPGETEQLIDGASDGITLLSQFVSFLAIVEDRDDPIPRLVRVVQMGDQPLGLLAGSQDHNISGKPARLRPPAKNNAGQYPKNADQARAEQEPRESPCPGKLCRELERESAGRQDQEYERARGQYYF
jgi:hypothetical protein